MSATEYGCPERISFTKESISEEDGNTSAESLTLKRLMNDPLWKGKTEEEVLLELGIVSKEELERAKEEVERLREEVLNA